MTLKENDKAPDFSLKNQDGKTVSLKDLEGKQVVLYFYPKDLTPGCTTEACDFNADLASFRKKGAVILGVSFDDEKKHQQFIKKHGLEFDLLVDNAKETAQKYGVYQMKKFMGREFMGIVRTTFVIGKEGKIKKIFPQVKVEGHAKEVLAIL